MRRAAGFSLLELVAVLSIFALVALIGVQVIQSAVRSSDRLTAISDQSGELALALALLRQDLAAALPREFVPWNGATQPALSAAADGFSLTVGGLARLGANVSGQGRVTWRLGPDGRLTRRLWTSLTPGRGRVPEVTVARGITRFQLSSFRVQGGWRPGFAADPRRPEALPLGLKVRLDHPRAAGLETVVSLR